MAAHPFPTSPNTQLSLSKLFKPTDFHRMSQTHCVKCQQNAKKHQVLDQRYFHHVSSLCKQGRIHEAVELFTKMELKNLEIGPEIYGELLQGCVYKRALSTGQQIHAQIIKNGECFSRNEYVETKLVIFYAKCDVYVVACNLFRTVNIKNVFSWAAIIGMNCRMGFHEEALLGFCDMLENGFLPDNFVIPNALKACGALQCVEYGKSVHGYAIKVGFGGCVFVASSLVDMYGKCGVLEDAKKVFDRMLDKNVVTWNSVLVGYVRNGLNEEAIKIFYNMRIEGVEPTQVTISSFLLASANIGAIEEGKQGHALAVVGGLELTTILGTSIINFYSKVGLMEGAELVFSRILEKDSVTWNMIISGYTQTGNIDKALDICRQMRLENLRFDSVTLATLMSASADTGNLKLGREGHCYCIRNYLESDIVIASSIVDLYAKCERIDLARRVFDATKKKDLILWNTLLAAYAEVGLTGETLNLFYRMQLEGVPPNVVSWNSLIVGFLKNGQVNEAKDMLLQMQSIGVQPNLITWTSLISGLAKNGFSNEAIVVFQQMQEAGIEPNVVSIVSLLSACIDMASLQYGKAIHGYLTRNEHVISTPLAISLVYMYAKCGNIDQAKNVFDTHINKELSIYNAMIFSYALHGQAIEALALYRRLKKEGLEPDAITFTNALYACSNTGLAKEGLKLFVDMVSKHHLRPTMVHYGCLVNLLSRCGNLDEVFGLIMGMPYEPDAHILGSLLAACRERNEIKLEEYLSIKLIKREPNNSGNYVALSNAYAAAGRWNEVKTVRHLMKEKGLMKIAGCSWIQIGGEFHVFVAGDKSHPKIEEINMILALVAMEMCFT